MKKNRFTFRFLVPLSVLLLAGFLRIWNLGGLPASLYWEEVALGYDAYSILRTGKDHHGNPFPVVAFESFGDYKPSGYFYAVVPFVKVLGLNAWAVRLPSAMAGVLTVYGVGVLAQLLLTGSMFAVDRHQETLGVKAKKLRALSVFRSFAHLVKKIRGSDATEPIIWDTRLVAMLITAVSPWAIQFSRGGWEVNLATCLVVWGTVSILKYTTTSHSLHERTLFARKNISLMLSVMLLVAAMYTYHATRIIAPLLGMQLAFFSLFPVVFRRDFSLLEKMRQVTPLAVAGIFAVVLCLPLLLSLQSDTTTQRFAETSIFTDLKVIEESNHLIAEDGGGAVARLIHHRYLLFGREMLSNALSHVHHTFLFISGDANPRHSIQLVGQLYLIEAMFLLLGVYFLLQRNRQVGLFLLCWAVIVLIPVSMTKATPHALRTLPVLPVYILLIVAGIRQLLAWSPNPKWCYSVSAIVGVLYIGSFTQFWHAYTKIYPQEYGSEWQYGYQQMVKAVGGLREPNEDVYITREQGRPAMYYWFFNAIDPQVVQAEQATARKDQGEFLQFERVHFVDGLSGQEQGLIVSSPGKMAALGDREVLGEVKDLKGKVIWVMYRNTQGGQ